MRLLLRRSFRGCLLAALVIAALLTGCGNKETEKTQPASSPSLTSLPVIQPAVVQPSVVLATITPTVLVLPSIQPSPTLFVPGPLFDAALDLRADPVEVPLELQIPALKVAAPVLGVGLTPKNEMDAPKGPIDDPLWSTAFWYRGSSIPGAPGTATFAAHVDDPLGRPEIFAHLQDLHSGDLIIIHIKNTTIDIRFMVDQVQEYTLKESSDPAVLAKIYGAGPVAGTAPQPSLDGLSHLTLITCAGNYANGEFDHHTVVYATRIK